jgi:hypothetical protein
MAVLFAKMRTVFTERSNSKFENVAMCQLNLTNRKVR